MGYVRSFFRIGLIVLYLFVLYRVSFAKLISDVPTDVMGKSLIVKVLDDFEKTAWIHRTKLPIKSDIKNGEIINSKPLPDFVATKFIKGIHKVLMMKELAEYGKVNNQYVLGIRIVPPQRDYYEIEVLAPKKYVDREGNLQIAPNETDPITNKPSIGIPIPGIGKSLSLWVHGRGYDVDLYIRLVDWKGANYNVKVGSLNYVGWRPLRIKIPTTIPQSIDAWPQNKFLVVHSLVLKTNPKTLPQEKIYMFFDHLIALTDVYNLFFDGMDLDFEGSSKPTPNNSTKKE